MSMSKPTPLVIHGWTIFAHPLFLAQVEALAQQVEALKQKDPNGYMKKNASKRLAAIAKLAFDIVPQDPTRPEYRQGEPSATITGIGSGRNFSSSTDSSSGTTLEPR